MPVMEKEKTSLNEEDILEYAKKIEQNNLEDNKFTNSLDVFLNGEDKTTGFITVGATSNALSLAGANSQLDVVIAPRTIAKCMAEADERYHGHGLSQSIMEQLPQELRNPVMIFKGSVPDSLVAITSLKDKENREIMIAVSLSEKENRHEVNRISSAYGRNNMTNYLEAQIEKGNLIAANTEKANEMLQSAGLQLPLEETFISFDNSIAYTTANVKYPQEELKENTQFHEAAEHEKLLPFLNAKAEFHESRLDSLKGKRDTQTEKIERNQARIDKLTAKADKLADTNAILESVGGNIPVIQALVERNEERIKDIRENKIPAREEKIKGHKERIAEIDKKSDIIGHKLERCIALSDTVKSFAILNNAERHEKFAASMDKLNKSTIDCLTDRREALLESLNFDSVDKVSPKLKKVEDKLDKLKQAEARYSEQDETAIDSIMENTSKVISENVQNGEMSVPDVAEAVCESNIDLQEQVQHTREAMENNPLKNAEMAVEGNYNSIDGIINNGAEAMEIPGTYDEIERIADSVMELQRQAQQELETEYADFKISGFTREDVINAIKSEDTQSLEFAINDLKDIVPNDSDRLAVLDSIRELQIGKVQKIELSETEAAILFGTPAEAEKAMNAYENESKGTIDSEKSAMTNREYFDSLDKDDIVTAKEPKAVADKIMEELDDKGIPYSAAERNDETVVVAVSSDNDKALRTAQDNTKDEKYINPAFYKSLDKKERFTQRMDEQSAKQAVDELKKQGIEHSAVIDGKKSAVTIRQGDYKKASQNKSLRDLLNREVQRVAKQPHKHKDTKSKNKDVL